MHVAIIPNRGSSPTILLRETYREDGKVKHHTVGNITSLGLSKAAMISQILKNKEVIPTSSIEIFRSRPHGHVAAILDAMKQLGLAEIISREPSRQRDLVLAMIAQRIIAPCSKLCTTREWDNTSLAHELHINTQKEDADSLYDAMDWLLARQDRIERKLAKRHLSDDSTILYDISSSYVEGECCPLAYFGHNRDGKDGKKIIVYGLMTDSQGCPVSIQAYPGNTHDSKTIPDQVDKIRNKFGFKHVIIVGDRGMLTGVQIEQLKKYPGLRHISALRSSSIRHLIEIGTFDRSLFDETNLAEVTSEDYPDERLIACHNPILEMRRQKKREELLVTTEKKLTKLSQQISKRADKNKPFTEAEIGVRVGKIVDKHKVAKHFEITIDNGRFSFRRNSESIQQESELDGIYVIRTNVPSEEREASDVVRDYKRLADVEKGFRTIKTTLLDIRPIHHHLEKRVRAHFLICMLSYYVVWHLRQAWSPYLFCDENLDETRATRNPVVAATPNENVAYKKSKNAKIKFKKVSKNNNSETNNEEHRVESFQSLLNNLATICQNNCRIVNEKNLTFENHTIPTTFQESLLNKIKSIKTTKN